MSALSISQEFRSEYSENILPTTALISDSSDLNYSGDGIVAISNDYQFSDNKSLKLEMPISTSINTQTYFNLGSDLEYQAKYEGNYIFSFRFLNETIADNVCLINTKLNVFVNSLLTYTFEIEKAENYYEDFKFYTFCQSFNLSENDIVNFTFEVDCEPIAPAFTLKLYFSGFKLELDDRFLGIPSIYSKPKDYNGLTSNIVFVNSLSDLPTASAGVITLEANKTYYFTTTIDLEGNRLVGSANTTILGTSSEASVLTSTGLGVGIPLYYSIYTTPIRHISISDVDTAVSFDGTSNPNDMALDWTGVNFVNVPNIGTIKKASNFIFDKSSFINSKGLKFDGTIGTIALGTCLLSGDGLAGNILEVLSTCTITRRFRVIYSSIIASGSTIGINVSTSASIPVESYILDTVNFSGGGTYISGVLVTDNKSNFVKCKGIQNTAEVSQYYMNGNTTTTVISATNTPTKVLGTTTNSAITQKFTHTNNRATYVGSLTRVFLVKATLSLESGTNNQIGCYIAKNGSVSTESEIYSTTSGTGRSENVTVQTLLELSTNDYVEIFVENATAITNVLVTDLNVIAI